MREYLQLEGRLTITLRDPIRGTIVLERCIDNVVTLSGRALLAELLTGAASPANIELVVGGPLDPGDPDEPPLTDAERTDTALYNELRAVPVSAGAPTLRGDEGDERMVTEIDGTLEPEIESPSLVMTEAGIKVTKSDGTQILYNRVVFERITKEADLQMTLTWEVIF